MDVSCPACAAKYTCDEEKLRGKTARMRCKACNTAWMVSGPGASAAPRPTGSMPPPSVAPKSIVPSVPPPASSDALSDSAKRAAVMKTGKDREKRDLFAPTEVDQGSIKVKDTLLPPPNFGFTTGSRNENSVLFRVDQLSDVGGRIKTPEPVVVPNHVSRASDAPRDEEGVIDLKSLSSPPPPGKPRSIIPVAPLFSEPPPMTMDAFGTGSRPSIAQQNKPISKAKLFGALAAAMVFLVVAGFGISFAFKGEEPVHHAAAVTPPPPAPVPVVSAAPAAEPAPATTVASNDDTDGVKKKKKGGKKKASGNASASNQSKAPVKPADPCGCKGDFNCIMACTVKNGH